MTDPEDHRLLTEIEALERWEMTYGLDTDWAAVTHIWETKP
jgi:hypothetical protein